MSRAQALIATALLFAGVGEAAAQFPPPPGQQSEQASPFPPAPGQRANPFPPAPGQSAPASPFPAPPGQGGGAFPPASGQAASPFPPVGGQSAAPPPARAAVTGPGSPFPSPGQPLGGGGSNPCDGFLPLRAEAEKAGQAIQAAAKRKAPREEVCPLFQRYAANEAKMVSFLEKMQQTCGIPAEAIKTSKGTHAKTVQVRNNVCSAGPAAAPRGPSLSDAFGGSSGVSDAPPKPGRGTFDTLTGSAIGR